MDALVLSLAESPVGLCLCDGDDRIRHVNTAFIRAFLASGFAPEDDFAEGLGRSIAAQRGIKLESMPLPQFVSSVRRQRRLITHQRSFTVDCHDGSWWWLNETKVASGWILAVANDMSTFKNDELALRQDHASALRDAQTDFLTGLANRRAGFTRGEAALARCRTDGVPFTLALIDIDHFKLINDRLGHDAGDDALARFSRSLSAWSRPGDHVSRIGGEEFLVAMPNTTEAQALALLRSFVGAVPEMEVRSTILVMTASAGIACARAWEDFGAVVSAADRALYGAKANGRARVECRAA